MKAFLPTIIPRWEREVKNSNFNADCLEPTADTRHSPKMCHVNLDCFNFQKKKGTDLRHGVLWQTWRGPCVRCLLHGDESEEEVQRRVRRGPCAFVSLRCDGETACERSESSGFHSVRWCLVGQRHYDDRSCIAVASLAWCGMFSSTSYRCRIVFRRRLPR